MQKGGYYRREVIIEESEGCRREGIIEGRDDADVGHDRREG